MKNEEQLREEVTEYIYAAFNLRGEGEQQTKDLQEIIEKCATRLSTHYRQAFERVEKGMGGLRESRHDARTSYGIGYEEALDDALAIIREQK